MLTKNLIDRPLYIEKLKLWQEHTDLVKILTGVRRCGKSKLFTLFQNHLTKHNNIDEKQIISINLEDIFQTREIGLSLNDKNLLTDYNTLLDHIIVRIQPDKMNYVFIDEVQLLENWQLVANALRMQENIDLYLTGSNAYMFSGDLANTFGGRYIEIKVQPYSFAEYYNALKDNQHEDTSNTQEIYAKYIKESSFPQTLDFQGNRQLINDYLHDTVYRNTIQKDIMQRYNISDTSKFDLIARYLFDTIGSETSLRNIENQFKASRNTISVPTIDKYIQGLLDSYLLYKCDRFDIKGKQILNTNPKYYIVDIGLRNSIVGNSDRDMGHMLENIVYLELLRRGYRVYVGKVKTKTIKKSDGTAEKRTIEVDFVAQKADGNIEYYQVALYALEESVLNRELASLKEIKDNYPKFLLSMDFGSGETDGIQRINVFDWLLQNK